MRSITVAVLLTIAGHGWGQTGRAPKPPDPVNLNQVYCYRGDSLIALGRTDGRMENKMKALGFGGSQMGYTMEGARAAVRLRRSDTLRFVIRLSGGMMDPSMTLQLFRFESRKSSRLALMSSHSRFGGDEDPKNQVRIDVQKSGTDVFILIPTEKLGPGEYGFMNKMALSQSGSNVAYTFYDFGVDP